MYQFSTFIPEFFKCIFYAAKQQYIYFIHKISFLWFGILFESLTFSDCAVYFDNCFTNISTSFVLWKLFHDNLFTDSWGSCRAEILLSFLQPHKLSSYNYRLNLIIVTVHLYIIISKLPTQKKSVQLYTAENWYFCMLNVTYGILYLMTISIFI